MRNFVIYFEFYGRKLKTTVLAENEQQAQKLIKEKIIFHKVAEDKSDPFNQSMNIIDDVIDILEKKAKK